ncbi:MULTISPECIES: endonuclease/exonuclease/phosphatase family protein [unclassified Brevibacterium]|uniref:endonuclease/exonuclease/phosphatase family protein n=1 Tax=unclassified Brevibacterium TaxID=2614124 RepID=UPI001BAD66C8|nr:endonuclease/exonuclease/phosphatase family protein [Brevibacterium sp. W7.2]
MTFTLQTWNVWFGGREVDFGQDKQYAIAAQFPAEILAVQECWGAAAEALAPKLTAALAQSGPDVAVLSTGEATAVDTDTMPFAQAALVRPVPEGPQVLVWSVHLAPYPYGPYQALAGRGQEIADAEEAERLAQITAVLAETERILTAAGDPEMPVVISGDFNAPATLDWHARADRPNTRWASTDAVLAAGFVDTYRHIHPDPAATPADTWSPIEPLPTGDGGGEPRDRIDFVFSRGLDVLDAVVRGCVAAGEEHPRSGFADVGGRCALIPGQRDNRFPSDHQLVETRFAFRVGPGV